MKKTLLHKIVKQIVKEQEEKQTQTKPVPSDVKTYATAQDANKTLVGKAKNIDTISEFSGAFEVWIKTLGMNPQKFSKSTLGSEVVKVLTKLNFK